MIRRGPFMVVSDDRRNAFWVVGCHYNKR